MSNPVNEPFTQLPSKSQQGTDDSLFKGSGITKHQPIKKRKYSRGGCKECKRRRLKCDEGKPSCWNCSHLNKVCVYEKKIKFIPSNGFNAGQNSSFLNDTIGDSGAGKPSNPDSLPSFQSVSSNVAGSSFNYRSRPLPSLAYPSNTMSSSGGPQFLGGSLNLVDSAQQIGHNGGSDIFQMPQSSHFIFATPAIPLSQRQQVNDNLFNGASNVISDLNDIIQHYNFDPGSAPFYNSQPQQPQTQQLSQLQQSAYFPIHNVPPTFAMTNIESNGNADVSPGVDSDAQSNTWKRLRSSKKIKPKHTGGKDSCQSLSAYPPPPISITTSHSTSRFDYLYVLNRTISSAELLSLCEYFGWSAKDSHINYIKIFVTKIHMKFIPFTTSFLNNAYIKCFLYEAKSSPHLLYAMLAISAKYELTKVTEAKSDISDAQREQALEFHWRSRSAYLSRCTEALDQIMNSKTKTLENIESLLMTILVLGSDFSGVEGSQWRSHLKGAKNLLLQYCKFRPVSLELVIVWLWFCSMETLAGLTTYNGGTIHDFDEMQEFLEVVKSGNSSIGLALRKFGFLFGGYYVEERGNPILKSTETFIVGERKPSKKANENYDKSGEPVPSDSRFNSDGDDSSTSENSDDSLGRSKKINRRNEAALYITVGGQRIKKVMNYNLYVGYNDDVMDVMNGIFISIECIRKFKQSASNDENENQQIFEVLNKFGTLKNEQIVKLFAGISKARSFTVINNKAPFRIPLNSPYHPLNKKGYHYNNPTGVNIVISGYIHDTNPNTRSSTEADNWYSWLDLSQQLYVDACLLRLLTMENGLCKKGLSIKKAIVQDVVNRMIGSLGCLVTFAKNVSEDNMKELERRFDGSGTSITGNVGDKSTVSGSITGEAKHVVETNKADFAGNSSSKEPLAPMFGPLTREKALDIQQEHELQSSAEFSVRDTRIRRGSTTTSQIQFQDYLYYQLDSRLVMVQWPLFVCGLCCVNPKHKLIISCCFNALINLGVESSEMTFARVDRLWHRQKEGLFDYENQNVFEDTGDSVPFT